MGLLCFVVCSDDYLVEFEIVFSDGGVCYLQCSGFKVMIKIGSKFQLFLEFFVDDLFQIDFGDGLLFIYSYFYSLLEGEMVEFYLVVKIEVWDWLKVNICVELQGMVKCVGFVQCMVIEVLLMDFDFYDVIFDDDGKGEIVDVVVLWIIDSVVLVILFYCKYFGVDMLGVWFSDLYEVCGQVQKLVCWCDCFN